MTSKSSGHFLTLSEEGRLFSGTRHSAPTGALPIREKTAQQSRSLRCCSQDPAHCREQPALEGLNNRVLLCRVVFRLWDPIHARDCGSSAHEWVSHFSQGNGVHPIGLDVVLHSRHAINGPTSRSTWPLGSYSRRFGGLESLHISGPAGPQPHIDLPFPAALRIRP